MKGTKKSINKHQHKLIVLISTLNYMNFKFKQYTQKNILYYFNNNLKNNKQKEIKLKTLQSYLYKLEKIFKVTMNYYKHLGKNFGTEIYYKLRYSKKECHYRINKYFKDKKEDKFQKRVNDYLKKTCIKNGSVEKWECSYNIYNNKKKKKKKNKQSIEKFQIKKYAKKCRFKSNTFLSIFNLKIDKSNAIEMLKIIKRTENFFENGEYDKNRNISLNQKKLENKQQKLIKILDETKISLENEGYNNKQLRIQIHNIYENYKNKPHFIIESNKYCDLSKIKEKLKKTVEHVKKNEKENERNIRNNIFSILLEQLQSKIDMQTLIPILKEYLNNKSKLEYHKVFDNHYYYDLLTLIKYKKNDLKLKKFEKITN